jgi:hypothetical protein
LRFSTLDMTSHKPGFRDGNSSARAGIAQIRTSIEVAPNLAAIRYVLNDRGGLL